MSETRFGNSDDIDDMFEKLGEMVEKHPLGLRKQTLTTSQIPYCYSWYDGATIEQRFTRVHPKDLDYNYSKTIGVMDLYMSPFDNEPMYLGLTKDHLWLSISEEEYNKLKPEFKMKVYKAKDE